MATHAPRRAAAAPLGHPAGGSRRAAPPSAAPPSSLAPDAAMFRQLFYENPQPMWVIDTETRRFVAVNDAAVAKYGYSAAEFASLTIDAIRLDPRLDRDFGRATSGRARFSARHRLSSGELIDVEVVAAPTRIQGRRGILSIIDDVTARKRLERELREGILRDPLTGGPNRALLVERIGHALARMLRRSATLGVLMVDLDHFKRVNESLGYPAGDAVLQEVAARIAATVRPDDTVARLSADEFGVLLEDVGDLRQAMEAAERVWSQFDRPVDLGGVSLGVGVSVGVACADDAKTSPEELLRNAELAMTAAKAAGRSRVMAYSDEMHASVRERLSLDQDLRRAVELDQLRVVYQPLVSVDDGRIVGCEALVRWLHPSRGLVAPDAFIPLAEETGLILAIDNWMLRSACAQVAQWRHRGLGELFVAVNVSAHELGRGDLVDRVETALWETSLPRDRLEVEVTETAAVAQPVEALEELRQLRRAGITVAIDDFGTGYSSLSKLATLPVDRLKIDRSFLTSVTPEHGDSPLVAAMIGMAHRLGLAVTAEGVETSEQLAFLRRSGCDLLQGYLVSPPVDARRFEELMAIEPPRATVPPV
jgi:diguanylate cyclase (GGDEF)-like protein/PAS domain S-box-containing protein